MARLTLIIAEDDPFMREWLALSLSSLDARVFQAANGHELAALLCEWPDADLVVSDIRMPGPSGLEVLATARREGNQVPFLFITGFGGPEVLATASALDAAVLAKPFSRRDLMARVDAMTGPRAVGGAVQIHRAYVSDEHK